MSRPNLSKEFIPLKIRRADHVQIRVQLGPKALRHSAG